MKQGIAWQDDITPADRGGSKSMRRQIRSPHSCGGLQGSCAAYSLWRAAAHLGNACQTDRLTDHGIA